jgi:hypothetical protein
MRCLIQPRRVSEPPNRVGCDPTATTQPPLQPRRRFVRRLSHGLSRVDQFQPRHSQQIIGSGDKVSDGLSPFYPQVTCSPKSAHRLDPAEDLLDPFAKAQAGLAAGALGRAFVQPRNLDALLATDMRGDVPFPAPGDEGFLMVAFVGSQRLGADALVQAGRADRFVAAP